MSSCFVYILSRGLNQTFTEHIKYWEGKDELMVSALRSSEFREREGGKEIYKQIIIEGKSSQ